MFLWHAIQQLLVTGEVTVSLLLDMPKHECEEFVHKHKRKIPNAHLLNIICITDIIADGELPLQFYHFQNIFLWKSYRFYQAVLKLAEETRYDFIEFFDYAGAAFHTARAKRFEGVLPESVLAIRAHCTVDLMDCEQLHDVDDEKIIMYEMEAAALRAADIVITPSHSWKTLYKDRYQVPDENIVVIPPPFSLENWANIKRGDKATDILFYGRLFQLKGVDVFVDAAVQMLLMNPDKDVRFIVVGYDGGHKNTTYQEYLSKRIPLELRDRFIFTGKLDQEKVLELLERVKFAVFPNYVESFSYSIHEIYASGVPIICRPIPAFVDYFKNRENALYFDGTVIDLAQKMTELYNDNVLLKKLSFPYEVLEQKRLDKEYIDVIDRLERTRDAILLETPALSLIVFNGVPQHQTIPDEVSRDKSYVLQKDGEGLPIWLFGEMWHVSRLDGGPVLESTLPLEGYAAFLSSACQAEEGYFRKALRIIARATNVGYVGSYKKMFGSDRPQIVAHPYDITKVGGDLSWFGMGYVIRNEGLRSLIDLFDPRLEQGAFIAMLDRMGYLIPEPHISERPKDIATNYAASLVFDRHNRSKTGAWIPSELPVDTGNVDKKAPMQLSWKRLLYQDVLTYLQSKRGPLSKIALSAAMRIARYLKTRTQ